MANERHVSACAAPVSTKLIFTSKHKFAFSCFYHLSGPFSEAQLYTFFSRVVLRTRKLLISECRTNKYWTLCAHAETFSVVRVSLNIVRAQVKRFYSVDGNVVKINSDPQCSAYSCNIFRTR